MPDIPVLIASKNSSSERRVSPAWTIAHFKARLEPITGIPASSQRLFLKPGGSQSSVPIQAANEDATALDSFSLRPYAEINVTDTRPAHMQQNYTNVAAVEKYEMPAPTYESLPDTVLDYKRKHGIGRFDPAAPSIQEQKVGLVEREIRERNIAVGARCRLLPEESDGRRGEVAYIGEVKELPGVGKWVGIRLDEPMGKNDGCAGETRYFEAREKQGVFVRPERIEVGQFDVLDDLDEEMEEI